MVLCEAPEDLIVAARHALQVLQQQRRKEKVEKYYQDNEQ